MTLTDNLLTSSLWKAVLKIFLGLSQFLLEALRFISLKVIMGFACLLLMPLFSMIFEADQGWPGLNIGLHSEWLKGTPAYFCMIGKTVFPEKCSWKGKIKPASYLEVMKLTKLGWFCFLVCYGRVFLVFYILFNASQCLPWQNRPSVHFCTGMSENGCVYCQENVSFHFETLK